MRETLFDTLRRVSGKPRPRQTEWRRLRGALWLDHAVWKSGLTVSEFSGEFIHRGRSASNLVAKWIEGKILPSRMSAKQLEKLLPGTLEIFDCPLFMALDDRPIGEKEINEIIGQYCSKIDWGWQWKFPCDGGEVPVHGLPECPIALVARGDIWGLAALVMLTRKKEAERRDWSHVDISKYMYRILPAVLRRPWASPHSDLLFSCIEAIRNRVMLSSAMFDVDYELIKAQSDEPHSCLNLELYPIDPKTDRFIGYDDPVLDAKIVSGFDVHTQRKY